MPQPRLPKKPKATKVACYGFLGGLFGSRKRANQGLGYDLADSLGNQVNKQITRSITRSIMGVIRSAIK